MTPQRKTREDILPIDRPGWGLVVVAAAAILFALHAGGFKCSGVILVELIEKYDGVYSEATLLWVFTVKYILTGLMGPVVSILIVKLGHRAVAMFGTFMMGVGWIGLAYSNSLITMIACHSVPGGLGNGMLAMVCFLVSGQYFIKNKALAIGIVSAGSGIGTITLPYIMRAFYDNFDFSGASLLYGAVCLQCTVLAALLRPISYYETIYATELRELCTPDSSEETTTELCVENHVEKQTTISNDETTTPLILDSSESNHNAALEVPPTFRARRKSFNDRHQKPDQTDHSFLSHSNIANMDRSNEALSKDQLGIDHRHHKHLVSAGDLSGSVYFVEEKMNNEVIKVTETEAATADRDRLNIRVLLLPKFWMVGLSLFVYALGTSVVYQGVPALGFEEGVPKKTVALMMLFAGVLEIPCRIANGFLADRHIISSLSQFAICIFCAGFMSLLCAIFSGIAGLALVLIGMSSMGTSIFSLIPPVFKDLIGAENVTSAMGVQLACQACGFIVSSYLTGLVYNSADSWRIVYYYIAGVMMLSSMITWPYCIYSSCHQRCHSKSALESEKYHNSKILLET